MSEEELRMAKIRLYSLLLEKSAEDVTDIEAEIGYALVRDRAIQDCLDKTLKGVMRDDED